MATANTSKLSREDYKRQKAIEEQRKAGTIPAEVDPETGRDINPHIPNYISDAPWYLDISHPTLKHQRLKDDDKTAGDFFTNEKETWYARGMRAAPATKKYRKGACENCGAMSHKSKDCLDRPRKIGAKLNGQNIQADEIIQNIELGFEAKRDRWNGYNPDQHMETLKEWELIDEQRRKIREQEAREKLSNPSAVQDMLDSDNEDQDEDKYADSADVVGQKLDTKSRTTVRNLRIREDTAKYLMNLDVNSAYYDPKTRSMRENPLKDKEDSSKLTAFVGDNFVRASGDAPKIAQVQLFSWEAGQYNKDIHMHANPSQAEKLFKEYQEKKSQLTSNVRESIIDKYGGEEHLKALPKELLLAQTEHYVEYSQTGRVIKGQEKAKTKSRYPEDEYLLNHTSVWGSYWKAGKWGYVCCHSMNRSAYCTGEAGKEAARTSMKLLEEQMEKQQQEETQKTSLMDQHMKSLAKKLKDPSTASTSASGLMINGKRQRLGEGEIELDSKKLKKAMAEEKKRLKKSGTDADTDSVDNRLKNAQAIGEDVDITQEELEAYRLLNTRADDPMANYKDEEDDD